MNYCNTAIIDGQEKSHLTYDQMAGSKIFLRNRITLSIYFMFSIQNVYLG